MDFDRVPHNLTLSHYADWNDALCTEDKDKQSESVFVAMQLALAFKNMAEISKKIGKDDLAKQFEKKHKELKNTINETCSSLSRGFHYTKNRVSKIGDSVSI